MRRCVGTLRVSVLSIESRRFPKMRLEIGFHLSLHLGPHCSNVGGLTYGSHNEAPPFQLGTWRAWLSFERLQAQGKTSHAGRKLIMGS